MTNDKHSPEAWREQIAARPPASCGRLDMHTYLAEPAVAGRITNDRVRYVYFDDEQEVIVVGNYADAVAFCAADWKVQRALVADLLAACEAACHGFDCGEALFDKEEWEGMRAALHAAIAKARGGAT